MTDLREADFQMDWLDAELDQLDEVGLLRTRRVVKQFADGWCEVSGRRLRNLASNDYLNLAHDPRVIAAAQEALSESSAGATASALVCGRTEWHERLEASLAEFEGTESVILFPSGYAANVGTIAALVDSTDVVFCDRLNHASLIDGCRLSGASLRVFRHDRLDVLERELIKSSTAGRKWIVTDGVFSMDGDLAPVSELCDLADRFDASVIVDEAHGTGVFGRMGRGVSELTDCEDRVAVRIGTLSKSIGTLGGFVAGNRNLCDWLFNSARSQAFSTALPPVVCAAATKSVELIQSEPERRTLLNDVCDAFREAIDSVSQGGISLPSGPIFSIRVGSPEAAVTASTQLEDAGFLVPAIRPPTVPQGTSRLRVSLTTAISEEEAVLLAHRICEVVG